MEARRILVLGGAGAIGRNWLKALHALPGPRTIVAGYNITPLTGLPEGIIPVQVDVSDKKKLRSVIQDYKLAGGEVYNFAALLSVAAENDPERARLVNMGGLENSLEVAKDYNMKMFWPSSMAVFGNTAPKHNTPQDAPLDPETEYGKNKVEGEKLLEKYFKEDGVDGRSLRFPGLMTSGRHGKGTTEYAIDMIEASVKGEQFTAPIDVELEQMYMPDAMRAISQIMAAPEDQITIRTSYNISAKMHFTPEQLAEQIRKHYPGFQIGSRILQPNERIAKSWPNSIDDSVARRDWNWNHLYGLPETVEYMIGETRKDLGLI